jgi:serine/threonine protein phosphatase PrpC
MLVIATDGLWDVMSDSEVVALCSTRSESSSAVSSLVKESRARWMSKSTCMDDITVCVAYFHSSME